MQSAFGWTLQYGRWPVWQSVGVIHSIESFMFAFFGASNTSIEHCKVPTRSWGLGVVFMACTVCSMQSALLSVSVGLTLVLRYPRCILAHVSGTVLLAPIDEMWYCAMKCGTVPSPVSCWKLQLCLFL